MCCDNDAPDMSGANEAARMTAEQSGRYLDNYLNVEQPFMRKMTERAIDIYDANSKRSAELSDYQLGAMKRNDERYWNVAVPFEDRLLEDVERFDSQAYKDQQVDTALADVTQQFDQMRGQTARALTRTGVNPNSGAYAAMQNQTGIAEAATKATAANKTRQAADQIGLSTKMQMYGGMKGLAGLGATNAQIGISSMGMGNNSAGGMTGAAGGMLGASAQAQGAYNSGMGTAMNGWIGAGNVQNAANANDPMNTVLGAAAGIGTGWALNGFKPSDRRLKKNIELVGRDERTGLNLYEYEYIQGNGTRYVGVMADEVEKVMPEAVVVGQNGYKSVDYALLGIEFKAVEAVE